jgi:hypothetical protein
LRHKKNVKLRPVLSVEIFKAVNKTNRVTKHTSVSVIFFLACAILLFCQSSMSASLLFSLDDISKISARNKHIQFFELINTIHDGSAGQFVKIKFKPSTNQSHPSQTGISVPTMDNTLCYK